MLTCPQPLIVAVPALALCSTSHQCAYVLYVKRSYIALLRHCTENSKQILSEMKLRGVVPNSYVNVSMSDLSYIIFLNIRLGYTYFSVKT
jgi:hypothetical protein